MSTSEIKCKVTVDQQKFVYVDGVKVARVVGDGRLQFCDKDKRRSSQRGSQYVEVSVSEIAKAASSEPVDK